MSRKPDPEESFWTVTLKEIYCLLLKSCSVKRYIKKDLYMPECIYVPFII